MCMISSLFIVCKIHGRKFPTSCDTVLLLIYVQMKIHGESNNAVLITFKIGDAFILYELFNTHIASCFFKETTSSKQNI